MLETKFRIHSWMTICFSKWNRQIEVSYDLLNWLAFVLHHAYCTNVDI
jgi:hypothetical protein